MGWPARHSSPMPAGPFVSATSAPVAPPRPRSAATAPLAPGTSALPLLTPSAPEKPWHRPAVLATVIALHALALAWLLRPAEHRPVTLPLAAPILVTLLPADQSALQPPAHQPASQTAPQPPRPSRTPDAVTPPRPTPAPRPTAAEQPVAAAPTAISEATAAGAAVPANQPTPAAAPGTTEAAPPSSPPRYDAAYLHNNTPYPPLARRMRESGMVRLRVLVSSEGLPETIELLSSSGSPRLDEGAQQAVRQWRFIPARRGDLPVASHVVVPIIYKLEES
jgi:periplasmic protein TonB